MTNQKNAQSAEFGINPIVPPNSSSEPIVDASVSNQPQQDINDIPSSRPAIFEIGLWEMVGRMLAEEAAEKASQASVDKQAVEILAEIA